MKTIGLLGGMSWESTELYYRLINEETKRVLGGLHSAPIAMVSVDFHDVEQLQQRADWDAAARLLSERARQVESAGAQRFRQTHDNVGTTIPLIELPGDRATQCGGNKLLQLHDRDTVACQCIASGLDGHDG